MLLLMLLLLLFLLLLFVFVFQLVKEPKLLSLFTLINNKDKTSTQMENCFFVLLLCFVFKGNMDLQGHQRCRNFTNDVRKKSV